MGDYEDQSVAPATSCTFASTERREGTLLFGKNNDVLMDFPRKDRDTLSLGAWKTGIKLPTRLLLSCYLSI